MKEVMEQYKNTIKMYDKQIADIKNDRDKFVADFIERNREFADGERVLLTHGASEVKAVTEFAYIGRAFVWGWDNRLISYIFFKAKKDGSKSQQRLRVNNIYNISKS